MTVNTDYNAAVTHSLNDFTITYGMGIGLTASEAPASAYVW